MGALDILRHTVAAVLVLAGLVGCASAAIGAARFRDVYERAHAARAAALALPLILAGLAVESLDWRMAVRLALFAAVLAMAGPALSHLIAHAAHLGGVVPAQRAARAQKSQKSTP